MRQRDELTSLYPSNFFQTHGRKRVEKKKTADRFKLISLCPSNVLQEDGKRRIEKENTSKRYLRLIRFTRPMFPKKQSWDG